VLSSDGRKLDTVDHLILDDASRRGEALVVHKLLRAGDKIVDLSLIDRDEEDGSIELRIDAGEAEKQPTFVCETFVEVKPEAALHAIYQSLAPGTLLGPVPVAGQQTVAEATAGVYAPAIPRMPLSRSSRTCRPRTT
jgi:hypothetical protein